MFNETHRKVGDSVDLPRLNLSGFTLVLIISVVVALFTRLVSLGLYPLTDPTEGRYADIGRRIVESSDWITPWIQPGVPFWGKPPLSFWMTGSSLQVLGDSAFAARLPHYLAGIVILWVIYDLLKRSGLTKAGSYAVALTAGSFIFYVSSGTIMTDAALAAGCALAMRGFWLAINGPANRRNTECYLFFIGLAVGLLAKGPVILVLSLLPIGLWTIYTRNIKTVLVELPWVRATLLLLLIALPWYVLAEISTPGFIEYFIVGEHWHRYLQKDWAGDLYGQGHGRPLGFIWLFGLVGLLPWTVLLPLLVWRIRKASHVELPTHYRSMLVYFGLCGVCPFAFFSISSNVLISYTLPAVAPLACLAAIWLASRKADKTIRQVLVAGVLFTAALSLTAVGYIQLTDEHKNISTEVLINTWKTNAEDNEPLYFYPWLAQSSKFYTSGQARLFIDIKEIEAAAESGKKFFIALNDDQLRSLPETLQERLSNAVKIGTYTLFEINNAD